MALPLVLAGAGLGLNLFSQRQAGKAAKQAAKYNAKLMEYEAEIMRDNADLALAQSKLQVKESNVQEAETIRQMTKGGRRLKASQVAGYAKSGAMIDEGTPMLVMMEQAGELQRDVLNTQRNFTMQQQGYEYQGQFASKELRRQALFKDMSASYTRKSGQAMQQAANIGAASSLLTGGANIYGAYTAGQTTPNSGSSSGYNPVGAFSGGSINYGSGTATYGGYSSAKPSGQFNYNSNYGSQVPDYLRLK